MKNLLYLLLFQTLCFSQSEQITNFSIGGSDFTNQPISCQSEFSKTQTLYYPRELNFKGTITEIRYTTSFENISLSNSNIWKVKIGTTALSEFSSFGPFIDTNSLTTVFDGAITQTSTEVIITFSQPFLYNGLDNMVIEVSETAPGFTSSAISGFKGGKNLGNPPLRSKVSFSGSTGGAILTENSYPSTKFIGTLERCIRVGFSGTQVKAISQTAATINIFPNSAVTSMQYGNVFLGQSIPTVLTSTTTNAINLTNLLPAQAYQFFVKSNCDNPTTRFSQTIFTTKQLPMTVPYTINFDGVNTRDYILSAGFKSKASVSNVAGNNSLNGILFQGIVLFPDTWSESDIWNTNTDYISQVDLHIDLTNNPPNPIFTFDLKQKQYNYFRVRINNIVKTWVFTSGASNEENFQKIAIDLSEFKGQNITLELQSLTQFGGPAANFSAFVDNIELKSATCFLSENIISTTATENSITLMGGDTLTNYDVAITPHSTDLADDSWTTVSLPHTFNNLTIAKAYKVYVRKKCSTENSPFLELYESTKTAPINIPFSEAFNDDNFNSFFVPKFNSSSNVTINSPYNFVNLHQKENGKTWFGGLNTTESQAWNENKNFVSSLNFRVNATNLSSMSMILNYKLERFFASNSSWFRILINGVQIPAQSPASFTTTSFDLSSFVGGIINIDLQHSGRKPNFVENGINDATYISLVEFQGSLATENFLQGKIKIFPNPAVNSIFLEDVSDVKTINVFTLEGKKIAEINNNYKTTNEISLQDISSGIYLLQFISDQNNLFTKFIKL